MKRIHTLCKDSLTMVPWSVDLDALQTLHGIQPNGGDSGVKLVFRLTGSPVSQISLYREDSDSDEVWAVKVEEFRQEYQALLRAWQVYRGDRFV